MARDLARVLMRVEVEVQREVEAIAQLEGRPKNHQYRVLIDEALEHRRRFGVSGIRRNSRQQSATLRDRSTFAEGQAKEFTATSRDFSRPKPMRRTA